MSFSLKEKRCWSAFLRRLLAINDFSNLDMPQPEVAGIAIGTGLDDLQKVLGEPVSVRTDSQTGDKIYSYSSGDAILSFWVRSSVVYAITFTKAAPV